MFPFPFLSAISRADAAGDQEAQLMYRSIIRDWAAGKLTLIIVDEGEQFTFHQSDRTIWDAEGRIVHTYATAEEALSELFE